MSSKMGSWDTLLK